MESNASNVYMSTQIKILRLLGTWPFKENTKIWKKLIAKLLFYSMLLTKFIMIVSVFYHIYLEWGHLPDPIDNAIMLSAMFTTTFGVLYIQVNNKRFQHLMAIIDKHFIVPNNSQEIYSKIFKNYEKLSRISTKLILVSAVLTITSYGFKPFMSQKNNDTLTLPFQASFPFDVTTGINYWIVYLLMEICVLAITCNGTANSDFIVSLIIKTTCQFSFLQHMILNIKKEVIKKNTEHLHEEKTR
ncbi:hypothetical protein L9F63_007601, partial [Diploptera punctata]